jgi:hypothetical protein
VIWDTEAIEQSLFSLDEDHPSRECALGTHAELVVALGSALQHPEESGKNYR